MAAIISKPDISTIKMAELYLWEQNIPLALENYRRAARSKSLQLIEKQSKAIMMRKGGGRRGVFSGLAITAWHVASNPKLCKKPAQTAMR